ncbi:MAG: iron-sulfur cluster biosynthesis family protein [Polyangiaceae bacterium]|jgi:iron-sulfur cluster assembly accessory protein
MTNNTPVLSSALPAVTAAAEQFMRRMIRFGGAGPQAGFRLVVSPGGCSGLSSEFTIESTPRAGDRVLEVHGIQVFLPDESCALLDGATIDFSDSLAQTGLTFLRAKGSGGCQTSSGPKLVQLGQLNF